MPFLCGVPDGKETFVKQEKIEKKVDCDFDKLKGINLGFELRCDSVERNTMLLTFSAFVVRILGKFLIVRIVEWVFNSGGAYKG